MFLRFQNSIPKDPKGFIFFQMLQPADEFDTTTSFSGHRVINYLGNLRVAHTLESRPNCGTTVVKNPVIRPYFLGLALVGVSPIASQLRTHDHQDQQQQHSCPSNRFGSRKKAIEPHKHRSQLVSCNLVAVFAVVVAMSRWWCYCYKS